MLWNFNYLECKIIGKSGAIKNEEETIFLRLFPLSDWQGKEVVSRLTNVGDEKL